MNIRKLALTTTTFALLAAAPAAADPGFGACQSTAARNPGVQVPISPGTPFGTDCITPGATVAQPKRKRCVARRYLVPRNMRCGARVPGHLRSPYGKG